MARLLASILIALVSTAAYAGQTLVVYTATWCSPCRQFHDDLARNPGLIGDRELVDVDVDARPFEAQRKGVTSVPTFVLEQDGREIRRTSGYAGSEGLKAWLDQP